MKAVEGSKGHVERTSHQPTGLSSGLGSGFTMRNSHAFYLALRFTWATRQKAVQDAEPNGVFLKSIPDKPIKFRGEASSSPGSNDSPGAQSSCQKPLPVWPRNSKTSIPRREGMISVWENSAPGPTRRCGVLGNQGNSGPGASQKIRWTGPFGRNTGCFPAAVATAAKLKATREIATLRRPGPPDCRARETASGASQGVRGAF